MPLNLSLPESESEEFQDQGVHSLDVGISQMVGVSLLEKCTEHGILMAASRQAVRICGGKSCH